MQLANDHHRVLNLLSSNSTAVVSLFASEQRHKCLLELPQFINIPKNTIWYRTSTVLLANTRLTTPGL
jgi:hypothetical protein